MNNKVIKQKIEQKIQIKIVITQQKKLNKIKSIIIKMSNPNQSTSPQEILSQPQVEPEQPIQYQYQTQGEQQQQQYQQQPEQQWFYNQQTGKWYDAYGREYVENTENNYQQEEGYQEQEGQPEYDQAEYDQGQELQRSQGEADQVANENEQGANDCERNEAYIFENKQAKQAVREQPKDGDEQNYYQGYEWKRQYSKQAEQKYLQNFEPNYNVTEWNQYESEPQQLQAQQIIRISSNVKKNPGERDPRNFTLGDITQGDRIKSVEQIKETHVKKQQKQEDRQQVIPENNKQTNIYYEKEKGKEKQQQVKKQKQEYKEQKQQKSEVQLLIARQLQASKQREKQLERQIEQARQRAKEIQRQNEKLKQQEQKQGRLREKEQLVEQKTNIVKVEQKEEKTEKKQKKEKKHKKSKQNKDQSNKKQALSSSPGGNDKKEDNKINSQETKLKSSQPHLSQIKGSPSVVAVSSLSVNAVVEPQIQPIFIIKEAQKQRIEGTLKMFLEYMGKHTLNIANQKAVYTSIYQQIDRRKGLKYVWYHFLKQYLSQNQSICKNFHELSYKIPKPQPIPNQNPHLNISQQLKTGLDQLFFLRKQNGNNYNRFNQFIQNQINIQLQISFNKYINDLNKAQVELNEKKNKSIELEEQLKKFVQKLKKIYQRGKLGKKQDEDVFVQTCRFVRMERQFRYGLVGWGRGVVELRKVYIHVQQRLNNDIQTCLNLYKSSTSTLYSIHPQPFTTIIPSKQQLSRQSKYNKLATLSSIDYIKYTLQIQKKATSQISSKQFEYFIQMPHFQQICGKSTNLLKGTINKIFLLKQHNQELVNTISGNLVYWNRETAQYKDKFIVKNLEANIVADGVVQFDQVVPGLFFNDNRSVRVNFRDQDRAEELICLLNDKM